MLTYPQIKSFDNKTESIFQSAETDRIINLIWLIRVYIGFHLDDLNLQPLRGSPVRLQKGAIARQSSRIMNTRLNNYQILKEQACLTMCLQTVLQTKLSL